MSGYWFYCKKCGRVAWSLDKKDDKKCDCCGSNLYDVPHEYTDNFRWRDGDGKQALIEELVKTSPEFDPYLFEHRDEILAEQSAKYEAAMAHGKAILEGRDKGNKFGVECPYCHATNVKKISISSKAVHAAVFGIFSLSRNSKQWHCEHCGSDF